MITYKSKKFNIINQNNYDKCINSLQRHRIQCSCGHSGCLIIHGYYTRSLKTHFGKVVLRILRYLCKECGKTHAVLPDFIVPYSQISMQEHILIIQADTVEEYDAIMEDNILIDESNISYIKRQFRKHWKQRLLARNIVIDENISSSCFFHYNRQFMQIKCTPNLLYTSTHTA